MWRCVYSYICMHSYILRNKSQGISETPANLWSLAHSSPESKDQPTYLSPGEWIHASHIQQNNIQSQRTQVCHLQENKQNWRLHLKQNKNRLKKTNTVCFLSNKFKRRKEKYEIRRTVWRKTGQQDEEGGQRRVRIGADDESTLCTCMTSWQSMLTEMHQTVKGRNLLWKYHNNFFFIEKIYILNSKQ